MRGEVARPAGPIGTVLLRIALGCCIFVLLMMTGVFNPGPGPSPEELEFSNSLFDLGMLMGAVAPLLAIVGAIIVRRGRGKLSVLDWISFGAGLAVILLPVLFVLAYSNCPNGVC